MTPIRESSEIILRKDLPYKMVWLTVYVYF